MNVHLIRSEGFSQKQYKEVVDFLQSFDGPVRFIGAGPSLDLDSDVLSIEPVDEKKFFKQESEFYSLMDRMPELPVERPVAGWKDLFEQCRRYREDKKLADQNLVILLTDIANEHNWFSALNPANPSDGFVHTDDWAFYLEASAVFPVAYLTASLVLQKHMFSSLTELNKAVHQISIGCINDFCSNKKEVVLKMRTADVCGDCMKLLKGSLNPLAVQHVLQIFEGVRRCLLFHRNFQQNLAISQLLVTPQNKILLPDYGNIEIKLTPLERTLYLFFLRHPEGIMLHDLVDYKEELRAIYATISTSGLLAEIHSRIDGLVDVTSNSASEKISKIKAAFVKAVGRELAEQYIIKGENGERKRIELPGDMVTGC